MALDPVVLLGGKDRAERIDRLEEIGKCLQASHLDYLQLDERPQKLEARRKLEGFVEEYLCIVPNERKFIFQGTADILHRSAATLKDFSGYRACTAWSAISLYAANLLGQPWRKEYRTLRTYSGYYKHEIEANLIGAELMFELMGYKHTGLGVLTLEGPVDPDKVACVSRDAIVALVECQIAKEIWEGVSKNFTISWLDVLEFRWNHVGTAEQAIRALSFRLLERVHQVRGKRDAIASYRDCDVSRRHGQPIVLETSLPGIPNQRIQPSSNHNAGMLPGLCNSDNVYPTDGHFYSGPVEVGRTSPCVGYPSVDHYYTVSRPAPIAGHVSRVPTGRLIELDTPLPIIDYQRNLTDFLPRLNETRERSMKIRIPSSDTPDNPDLDLRRRQTGSVGDCLDYGRHDERQFTKQSTNSDEGNNGGWDFVYKSLDCLGYSKDLGERDDVLRKKQLVHHHHHQQQQQQHQRNSSRSLVNIDNEDKYGAVGWKEERPRVAAGSSLGATNYNETDIVDVAPPNGQTNRVRDSLGLVKKSSLESRAFESNLSPGDSPSDTKLMGLEKRGKKYSNTLPMRNSRGLPKSGSDHLPTTKNADSPRKENERGESRWNCATCTFLNPPERDICEMCGKSRRKGNEDKPLASGGKQCPKCTLVNEKNAASCEVCNASLEDSPTYI